MLGRQASEGAERLWPGASHHGGPWGPAAFPALQPAAALEPSQPHYHPPAQPNGFGLTGGYSPFQAAAYGQPEWAQDLPRGQQYPMSQYLQHEASSNLWEGYGYCEHDAARSMEAAQQPPQQLPGGFLRGGGGGGGLERRPPLFYAAGRAGPGGFNNIVGGLNPNAPNPVSTTMGVSRSSGSVSGNSSLPSPEGTFRPPARPPQALDSPFRGHYADTEAPFRAAAHPNFGGLEPAMAGDTPPYRMHPAHVAVQQAAGGLRHAGSAPSELPAFGQRAGEPDPPLSLPSVLLWPAWVFSMHLPMSQWRMCQAPL